MATFPTARPSYAGFTGTHTLVADNHGAQHNAEQADISAESDKIGLGASTPTNNTLLRGNGTGTSTWAQANLTTDVTGVLPIANGGNGTTSTTGTGSVVFSVAPALTGGGSWGGSPTITTPVINDFTNSQHTHANASGGGLLNGANAITDGTITPAELMSGTGSSWAWQPWTPSWTNLTIGNGVNSSTYVQHGKTVFYKLEFTVGSTTVVGTNPTFSFPVESISYIAQFVQIIGRGILYDVSAGAFCAGTALWSTTTTALVAVENASATYLTLGGATAAIPFTWAVGDIISVLGMYQAI